MRGHPGYRPVDGALLRASVAVETGAVPGWPDSGNGADADAWQSWISQAWAIDEIAAAVTVASPVLADRAAAARAGAVLDPQRLRRIAVSLAGYVTRLYGRATPFGLFAGVAPLRLGARAQGLAYECEGGHRAVVRADADWLASVIAQLECSPALLDRLPVVADNLAEVRGSRLVMARSASADEGSGTTARATATASLRYTAPVRFAVDAARSPVAVHVLVDKLAAEFPQAGEPAARELVTSLVATGALITSLRPPLTAVDGLDHLLTALAAVKAVEVPQAAQVVRELAAIRESMATQPGSATGDPAARLAARMRTLANCEGPSPLAVDLRLSTGVSLPAAVAAEAASAASVLVRLSAHPEGPPTLREYHQRFLARFGPGAVVPVVQLVSRTRGLGYPRDDRDPRGRQRMPVGRRDEVLLALAQQAALDGVDEVLLDEDTIGRLTSAPATDRGVGLPRSAPHLDVCVEVLAASAAALDARDFRLSVTGIGQSAIATSGRFLSVLPRADQERLVESYAALPVAVDGAFAAQVSFPPRRTRARNVLAVAPVLPAVISLGEHRTPGAGDLDLPDLAVTADLDRMYVVSLSRRRVVEPTLVCAAARHVVPPMARLLVDVARATSAPVGLFDWGAAAGLPSQPRLRYGRSIVAPARWRVPRGAFPGADAPLSTWLAAVGRLRERLRLPERIAVGVADRQLRLRLDDPMHVDLLRDHLRRSAPKALLAESMVTLTEAPSEDDLGWCAGRANEVLIPVASTATPAPAPPVLAWPGTLPLLDPGDDVLPGAGTLYAKVYGDPDGFTSILIDHLPALLADWDTAPCWWFVRYRDPVPHLRMRLRAADYGRAAAHAGAWVTGLRRDGLADTLTLDTYRPEPARYGRGAALAAAEELFATDSAAALAELTAVATVKGIDQQALTAASLVDLTITVLGSRAAGLAWLVEHRGDTGAVPVDRESRLQALRLAATYAEIKPPADSMPLAAASTAVASAWRARRDAAGAYARLLRDGQAGPTPDAVLGSLLHLHHNRVHGPGPAEEDRTHRLARAIALAHAAGAQR
ncbi:lantibiotic dehydratase [Frankia sp. AgB32]|uniref:lantibiotic dehydratase n=1 Tax=Frankia sp. AgB32 TaxID=631119 RepID=UPI00200C4F2A|nr:lantibiotic dehydratase [Frankia sp. AgB32]MCK9895024.1 lantibiotic dehydratase [Frankia sp. AgB32]